MQHNGLRLLFLDPFFTRNSVFSHCANQCRRRSPQGNSGCAGKSWNGHNHLSKVQWAGTKLALEMVRSGTGDETATSGDQTGFSRYVHFLLPLVLERSRTGARKVSLGDCRPGVGRGAGARTNACDSSDAVLQPGSSPGVVSELWSAARQQTHRQGRANLAADFSDPLYLKYWGELVAEAGKR